MPERCGRRRLSLLNSQVNRMSSLVNKLLFLAFVVKGRGFVELKARLGPLKKCVDSKAAYGV